MPNINGVPSGFLQQGGSFGASTVNAVGGAASDVFAGFGDEAKASGYPAEQQEYGEAATLAQQNEQFTADSTAIKEAQLNRESTMAMGRTEADVAGAGFANSGSALDLLRSNAQQGSLTQAVASQQGLITEAGYQEQQESYEQMANAAGQAAGAAKTAATGAFIGAGISAVAAVASLA
jgi:hypothetical protein